MKMSETWQMNKQRNACCIHWRGNQSRKQFRIFHPIANTSCVAVDSDRLKCSTVTLVESILAFRMLAFILWLQDTLKMELPRYPETSGTTRLTSQRRISEEASLHQYLCENLKSHIPCGWASVNLEANGGPFESSEYYWLLLLAKFNMLMMTSPRNKKNNRNFVGYFHVLPNNTGASARNNVWNLSF